MAVRRQRKLMGHAILRHAHPGREALPLVLLPKRIAALHHRLASAPVHSMPGWLRAFMLFGFHRQRPSCKDVDLLPGRPTSQERGRSDIYGDPTYLRRHVASGVDVLSVKIGALEVEKSLCDRHLRIRTRRS